MSRRNRGRRGKGRRANLVSSAILLLLASPIAAPQLLAFPHSGEVGGHAVYSEIPITPAVAAIVSRADAMAAKSPIAERERTQPIILTNGGWRWTWLTLTSRGAFALSRPGLETIVVNRSDPDQDMITNGKTVAGRRSLSGTLAHEMTHGAIRDRFGLFADLRYPLWVREGYCDHVAGGGSLTDEEAMRLMKSDPDHPALEYFNGRKRVAATLQRNGGSVEQLFARSGA